MINGTVLEAGTLAALPGIRHGFFTREGGVSSGIYESLNVGLGSDDDQTSVHENRRRIADHLGARFDAAPLPDVATNYQVHSATARIIDRPDPPGERPKADALVTATPGLAIGALTADCTPVLFADADARVIGAAHAGWRGAVSGILDATVSAMESLGATRKAIRVAIGPTISQAAYEVGPEFEAQFLAQSSENKRFFRVPRVASVSISICRLTATPGWTNSVLLKSKTLACAPTPTNCFSLAIGAKHIEVRPITVAKSPPSCWLSHEIHNFTSDD